jgi:hypothetical protein
METNPNKLIEEKKTTTEMMDDETHLKKHERRQRRKAKIDGIIVAIVGVMFVGTIIGAWWWGTVREPIVLRYCGKDSVKNHAKNHCDEYKLSIPFIYYGGYPLDFSRKDPRDVQRLEVAYPSMQAWNSLSILEKWNAQKIEIDIWIVTSTTVQTYIDSDASYYSKGVFKRFHVPELRYGLDQYLTGPEPHNGRQYYLNQRLIPHEPIPRMYINCAYRDSNPDVNGLGCHDRLFTEWGLSLDLYHKLILLPHWSDIHDKVQGLIQSFVVNS